jgi:hypothetical protein
VGFAQQTNLHPVIQWQFRVSLQADIVEILNDSIAAHIREGIGKRKA